jgi:NADH:ubiquinone oxidoreductase subunit C
MNKIATTLHTLKDDIKRFYDKKVWHFLGLNGVKIDSDTTQIQWIFAKYSEIDEIVLFYVDISDDSIVPSVRDILPSAIISQREVVDMFGITIEGSQKGLYLDEDSESMPLSSCGI